MDIINFLISLTPFWTIPMMIIALQMGWTFKKRAKKTSLKLAIFSFCFALFSLLFFIWSGSPKTAVRKLSDIFYLFEN
jgi:hypothetical protein